MRSLLAKEKGDKDRWDLKLAAGGLVEVDFVAQFLALAHGERHGELLVPSTEGVLVAAQAAGLLDAGQGEALRVAHALMATVLQWQRLTVEGHFDAAKVSPALMARVATAAGLPDARTLDASLAEARGEVRRIFTGILGRTSR